eukprot:TRINITY_DN236_c0_g1_i1.p1 TRINITY_DN236_c0_g1~~TRINITY_DN236_c0_g1_i1.p1  ORF type:complete len:294 (-),score=59.55 TRINITY_DN236_c0_g1_i1:455-1336(-)
MAESGALSELILPPPKPESVRSFPLEPSRASVSAWGCSSIESKYAKKYKVGQGSYGEVYKAVQKETSSTVAIKRMTLERSSEGFPAEALNEIRLLRKLSHSNVIRLLDVGVAKYRPVDKLANNPRTPGKTPFDYPWSFFMVCEYGSHSLSGLLERRCIFSTGQVKCIMKQILEGLSYLHSNQIVHRDIKCSNILVNADGIVKVADFGLSTRFVPTRLINGKKTVATLWYRAPELLMGVDYSEAIDMWAVGCVMGELILGKPIFMGKDNPTQLKVIKEGLGSVHSPLWEKLNSM